MNKKIEKVLLIFLILQPIFDLITSFLVRNIDFPITLGILIRGLTCVFCLVYLIFYNNSQYKKLTFKYLIVILSFCILYFITKRDMFNFEILFNEIVYMFKYFYFIIILITVSNLLNQYKTNNDKVFKSLSIASLIYALLLIVPVITDTALSSYIGGYTGSNGWFFSANETGAILTMLLPLSFYLSCKNNKLIYFVTIFIITFAMILIGTKTAFIGIILTSLFFIIYYIIQRKKIKFMILIFTIFVVLLVALSFSNLPVIKNLQQTITSITGNVTEPGKPNQDIPIGKPSDIIIFSGRTVFLKDTAGIYINSQLQDKLFGIGFNNRSVINNEKIKKLIEMDMFDIFFRYGVIGFTIYFLPLLYIIFLSIKSFLLNKKAWDFDVIFLLYFILLSLGISFIAGHILGAPSVSIYLAILFAFLLFKINLKKETGDS